MMADEQGVSLSLGLTLLEGRIAAALLGRGRVLGMAQQDSSVASVGSVSPAKVLFECLRQARVSDLSRIGRIAVVSQGSYSVSEFLRSLRELKPDWRERLRFLPGSILEEFQFRRWLRQSLRVLSHGADAFSVNFMQTEDVWPLARSLLAEREPFGVVRVGKDQLEQVSGVWMSHDGQLEVLGQWGIGEGWEAVVMRLAEFSGFSGLGGRHQFLSLAEYGEPRFVDRLKSGPLVWGERTCQWQIDHDGLSLSQLEESFGGPVRPSQEPISSREIDLAASLASVFHEFIDRLAEELLAAKVRHVAVHAGEPFAGWARQRLRRHGEFIDVGVGVDPVEPMHLALASALLNSSNGENTLDLRMWRSQFCLLPNEAHVDRRRPLTPS